MVRLGMKILLTLLLVVVVFWSPCEAGNSSVYGRLDRSTGNWLERFNGSSAVLSGNVLYLNEMVQTYVCRMWTDVSGQSLARVGMYSRQAKCCAVANVTVSTTLYAMYCNNDNSTFLRNEFLSNLTINRGKVLESWTSGRDGIYDAGHHRDLVIGGAQNFRDEHVCRFIRHEGDKVLVLQGGLTAGQRNCTAALGFTNASGLPPTTNSYELLRFMYLK